ncbi:MAG TPA: universal stress protein [Blastocatellia bacterium]|nr:universal stress protein [Blastocatellia bacterium]
MKVLLATDGSDQATTAFRAAARLLRREDNEFDLLCVAPEFYFPKGKAGKAAKKTARMVEAYDRRIRAEALQHLIQAQAMLTTLGVEAGTRVEVGSPARVITRLAAEYDITVVGAHDQYTRSKPGLGPVASRVVAAAPGAVLIGRELNEEGRQWRILAAVDGSLASERALEVMASSLQVGEAEITLLSVAETPWVHLGLDREWFDYPPDFTDLDGPLSDRSFKDELQREATSVVEYARRRLERHALSATLMITEGDPALEILSEAERGEYDLIVIGATGEGDLKHDLLGSVSTKVAQAAICSTLVVKF